MVEQLHFIFSLKPAKFMQSLSGVWSSCVPKCIKKRSSKALSVVRQSLKAPVGIKNSWKYEKDLMIIFNRISVIFTITRSGNKLISSLPIKILIKACFFAVS